MAAKDLQMLRTRGIQVNDPSGVAGSSEFSHAGSPLQLILGAMRRQWPLLTVAVLVSGAVAWFTSEEFAVRTVTVQMQLSSQRLPLISDNVYTTPNAEVVSELLVSEAVLQPVVEKHQLLPVPWFSRALSVKPNTKTGTIAVELAFTDKETAGLVLSDIASEIVKIITQNRKDTLVKHAAHFNDLLLKADTELAAVRSEFVKLQDSERLTGNNSGQQNAELQGLVTSKIQLESALELSLRQQSRIRRDEQVLAADTVIVRNSIYRDVLAGRLRQAENVAKGLTSSARIATTKVEIKRQLTQLEVELDKLITPPGTSGESDGNTDLDAAAATRDSEPLATPSAAPAAEAPGTAIIVQTAAVETAPAGAEAVAPLAVAPPLAGDAAEIDEEVLAAWVEKVSAAGKGTLGDLDPQTLAAIESAKEHLARLANEARRLKFAAQDIADDLDSYQAKQSDLVLAMERAGRKAISNSSIRGMELESTLTQKEAKYAMLSQRLDQINQIKDCQQSEYYVSRPAVLVAEGESSNRKKLFVFALFGSGLLLIIPSAVIELLRLRPSPISVVSRRWNLPVLGVQSSAVHAKHGSQKLFAMSQQEIRLMALRIQQSLFRPEGRVVLFSGLDHEESPMSLIRSLANCFSQREESVLMIQAMPCQLEINAANAGRNKGQTIVHPGVAEFLAGEYEDATQLVKGTGVVGVDFLPGGCSVTASEAMASSRLTALIDQFRGRYSMILLCGPSTLHPADLQMVAARADGIVFTVTKRSLQTVYGAEVISDLIELGAPILGFAEQPLLAKKAFPADHSELEETSATTLISA